MSSTLRGGRQLLSPLPNNFTVSNFLDFYESEIKNSTTDRVAKDVEQPFLAPLDAEESKHAIKVLRLKQGEEVKVLDCEKQILGYGQLVHSADKNPASVTIKRLEKIRNKFQDIVIGMTENKIMEECVETLSAIGASSISIFKADRSQNKQIDEHKIIQRLLKKRDSALKQSFSGVAPLISLHKSLAEYLTLNEFSDTTFVLVTENDFDHLKSHNLEITTLKQVTNSHSGKCRLILGPEGGYSLQELEALVNLRCKYLTLGKNILRAEVAAGLGLACLNSCY